MTDIPADTSTTASVAVGGTFDGTLETVGDHDWIAVNLTANTKYTIALNGVGSNALVDPYVYLRDASGTLLAQDDDSGGNHNSRLVFTPTTSGTYYVDAAAWNDGYTGNYEVSVQHFTQPPVYNYTQMADQLVNGYWDGDWHHFDVTQGGTLTVNLTGLTTAGQTLARAALQEWSDVIGVNFKEVTGTNSDGTPAGQIVFDDSQDGAFTSAEWSNHVTSTATVNVSTQWLTDYGTTLDSYSFQTFVHEIGHALGLGHAGNYNDNATYPDNALYANDAWSTSVMSYFSQSDSSYFANQGFSYDFALTPMGADIVAVQELYGLSTTTRTGNTIYGYGTNSGNPVFDTAANPHAAYTIVDSGGIDTLDYSQTSAKELINLNPTTFSNVGGEVGNMSIAVGTVIENAKSGSGNDTIIGNSVGNVLDGGAGTDTVSYEAATGGVTVNLSKTAAQNTGGAGTDTLTNFENLTGSAYADVLTGRGNGVVHGGAGDDVIRGSIGGDHLDGDAGNDVFVPGSGQDTIDGGAGWDRVDFSSASAGTTVDLSNQGTNDYATYTSVEEADGSAFADHLTGSSAANTLRGNAGNDTLVSGGGNDLLDGGTGADTMSGGTGNDTYLVENAHDVVTEYSGEGTDTVRASTKYTLGANVENLTLTGSENLAGTGNDLSNVIEGNSGNNVLYGYGGDDRLVGNGGNDRLDGASGRNGLYGGTGDDIYYVENTTTSVHESANQGTDLVIATVNFALPANVENLMMTDAAVTGRGNDLDNVIRGDASANSLYGYGGNDHLYGYDGDDKLDGGAGVNYLHGGTGDDTYYVSNSSTYVYENPGEGTDRVYASVSLTLRANIEYLFLTGSTAIHGYGNDADNSILGNDAANSLRGMGGDDKLDGGGGADAIAGNDGDDWLEGGAGRDVLTGGAGKDSFVFRDGDLGSIAPTADRITDFTQGEDVVRLNYVDANTTLSGDQAFHFMGTADFDATAGELRYEQISGNTYISGDTNGDGTADFMIRLDGLHTLTSHDFVL